MACYAGERQAKDKLRHLCGDTAVASNIKGARLCGGRCSDLPPNADDSSGGQVCSAGQRLQARQVVGRLGMSGAEQW